MKITKRVTAWLLALIMVLTILPTGVFAAADAPLGYGRSILAQMDNADALLYMYDVMAAASYGTPTSISLAHDTYKITWEEACTVYDLVLNDHPDIFWHSSGYSGSVYDGYAIAIKPTYRMTGAALETAKAALESRVTALTADLTSKSDYEKSRLLHDRLAAATLYQLAGEHQTAYGALVQGTAVCAGYARAYQLLMQRVGIPTWYVTGTSISPDGQVVDHAWNLVQLDGEWYYTDVTWDDQTSYTFYAYLNNTYEQMQESHFFGAYTDYLPTATATKHNYFIKNDLQMEQYSVEAMAEVIRNHYPPRVYVTGDKAAFMKDYTAHLLDLCDALNAPSGAIRYGYASLGREIIFTLQIDHTCQYTPHTVQPTCTTDGYTVEICSYEFCHNERGRVVLPANGAHTYDNDCDAACNQCGYTREGVEHTYDNACDTDCNACGSIRTVAGHDYTDACDADCNHCGATRTAPHVYDDRQDTVCNDCGYTRPLYLPGDANDDGAINNRDLALLMRHINGWSDPVLADACDVNDDGQVNNRDLALLMRFLNGWDITLK